MSKILIIEDDEISCEIITNILSQEGYELITADNGNLGLDLAKKDLPDLIISDIMMPEMDGYTVLSNLKNDPRTAVIPFVFLTAKGNKNEIREGMGLGASDYLTKPFHSSEILQVVKVQIEKYKKITGFMDELNNNLVTSLPQEFYTPLNSILGFSSLLQEAVHNKYQIPLEQLSDYIDFIHESGKKLLQLAQNYVMFTNLLILSNDPNAKQSLLNKTTKNVSWIVTRTAEETVRANSRLSDLHCDIQDVELKVASEYLERLISEVIENFVVYTSVGNKIIIVGKEIDSKKYSLCLTFENINAKDAIEEIKSFLNFQLPKEKQYPLMGVGLALTRQIVFLYQGEITIEEVEGKNLNICIHLPNSSS